MSRAVARPADVDNLADAVATYEDSSLPEEVKVALRLADAFLTRPRLLGDEVRKEARATFTPEQIAELVIKFIFAMVNKANVALGYDAAIDNAGVSVFDYDQDGYFVIHGLGAVNRDTG